jgi:hypothetical protein
VAYLPSLTPAGSAFSVRISHIEAAARSRSTVERTGLKKKLIAVLALLCAQPFLAGAFSWWNSRPPDRPTSRQDPIPVYSTTVFGSAAPGAGLRGLVYELVPNMPVLPYFAGLHPVTTLYTKTLNIPPQDFLVGIPGVARVEWFAIDYSGTIWISKAGKYHFEVLSDDGSRVYVDEKEIINNDGIHPPVARRGAVSLKTGPHKLRVAYFQGPRQTIALVLTVKPPGSDEWKPFNTDDFQAPKGAPGQAPPK